MERSTSPTLFVSYSHDDTQWRECFRRFFQPPLAGSGVEWWADDHIRVGDRWERQIDDALDASSYGLLLVTESYLSSSFIWQTEVPRLVERGVPLFWVLVKSCDWASKPLLAELQCAQDPVREGPLDDARPMTMMLSALLERFSDQLVGDSEIAGAQADEVRFRSAATASSVPPPPAESAEPGPIFGSVPSRPSGFVARQLDMGELVEELSTGTNPTVGVTGARTAFGLYGQGGIGKTVLAAELARDDRVRRSFPDGVFWLTLGESPDILRAQRQLLDWLGAGPSEVGSTLEARRELKAALAERRCLVIVDDVWSFAASEAFAVTGEMGRVLYTTRDERILDRIGASTTRVDALSEPDARALLARLGAVVTPDDEPHLDAVFDATERVALPLALVGATVARGGQSWASVADDLLDPQSFRGHPYANTFKAMDLAMDRLGPEIGDRYQALSCFPEDASIPVETVARLWGDGLEDTTALLSELAAHRLLQFQDTVSFHDLQRDFLLLQAEAVSLAHQELLDRHEPAGGDWTDLDPADPYMWDHLAHHLGEVGRHAELVAVVTDPRWLAARIRTGGASAAERDVSRLLAWEPEHPVATTIQRRLQQTSHLLAAAEPDEVAAMMRVLWWGIRDEIDMSRLESGGLSPVWLAEFTSTQLVRTLAGHDERVMSIDWSPDGTSLATASGDETARLWDTVTGAERLVLRGHSRWLDCIAWSPSGRRLATGSGDDTVRIWDTRSGSQVGVVSGLGATVRAVAWSPDGTRIAAASTDGVARVWDSDSFDELLTYEGHDDWLSSVAWSVDGSMVVTASADLTAHVWDSTTGTILAELDGHREAVLSAVWSPDGTRIATASADGTARVWQMRFGRSSATAESVVDVIGRDSVDWSPDGTRLATDGDGSVRVWDAATGVEIGALAGHIGDVTSVAWSPDGTRIATTGRDSSARIWDLSADIGAAGDEPVEVRGIDWSPDGSQLVAHMAEGRARAWQRETGSPVGVVGESDARAIDGRTQYARRRRRSPDGLWSATIDSRGTVLVDDGRSTDRLVRAAHEIIGWAPNGALLAVRVSFDRMAVWDAASRTELRSFAFDWQSHFAWSADGDRCALADSGRLSVYSLDTDVPVATLNLGQPIVGLAWAPCSELAIATAHALVVVSLDPLDTRRPNVGS